MNCFKIFHLIENQKQQEQDPTNLYITNLPPYFKETDLEKMLSKYGHVVSTKILCDAQMNSRGKSKGKTNMRAFCGPGSQWRQRLFSVDFVSLVVFFLEFVK